MDGMETQKELANDALLAACKYTKYRMDWAFYTNEEKAANDKYRTSCHNRLIDALNTFLRYLSKENKDAKEALDGLKVMSRKAIGDIGNYLAYQLALSQR